MTEKSVLYSGKKLIITLVDEGQRAHLVVQSTKHGPDLYNQDDVIVILDGQSLPVETLDRLHVRCELPRWSQLIAQGFNLMVRVDEFYSSWDFGDRVEDDALYLKR